MKAKTLFIIAFAVLALLLGRAAKEAQNSYAYTNYRGQTFAGNSAYASGTWTTKAPMSIPRDRAAAVALDGKVYVIGGANSSGALASMEVYDPATNTWTTKASMPGPKSEPGAAVANGRIYVVGPPDNQLYEYNPATNTWAIKAPLPATPAGPVAVASISGRIFVTFNVSGESRWRLYVYDPFQDTWERRSDHPDDRRSIAALGVSNGMIYAVGGGIAGQTPQETTRIDRYDPSSDQWTVNAIPPMATPRTHLGATLPTIYGRMFVFGGWDGYTALSDAEVYDSWTNTWSTLPPMPTARYKAAYAAVGYKIYVIGGNWGGAGGHWLTTNEEFSLPEPAQPENPIVFVSGWDGHYYYEIFTMNPDGNHQLRLTNDGCANWHPTWTPDGKRILFSTDCRGHRDIYSMNPDGSDWRRLTFTPGWDVAIATRPFMSPDGRTIAFLQGLPPDNMHIWLMNPDGSNPRQLTTGPGTEDDTAIAWSPDSRQIVFRSTRSGNWQLWRINVDGTGLTQLTNLPDEAHDPAWSPDGSTIAFASQGEIMLMNPDGSNIRTLPGPGWEFRPAWSPDGTRLVYGSYRGSTSDIYSKKIDNTDERNLTNSPDSTEWDPAWARIVGSTTGERKILLYGGATAQTVFGDLWQYDGNDWTEIDWTGPGPGIRYNHGMVFDERRGRIVVFGGHDGTQALGDTWEYSITTGSWALISTTHNPSPRWDAKMVYDKRRGVTVLFGGTPGSYIFYRDTWEYDGTDWHQITTPHSPPGALGGAMVYDEARGRVVLVTGWQAQGFGWVNETWEYDGTDWTYITQAPSWRYNFALAYDSARQRVVLFGGFEHGGIGCGLGDTWEYDGQRWTRITTPHAPPGRCGHAMTYDPLRQRVVLFGGDVGGGNYYGDTWEYDGSDWYQVPTSHQPPGRVWAALAVVTSGGIDLFVSHLEVTQAIQDENNSVPLIAGKPTFVRVYVDCGVGCTSVPNVTGVLRGYGPSGELPGSPLSPINRSVTAYHEAWQSQRDDLEKSLNFMLPSEWLTGTVTLSAQVYNSTVSETVTFQSARHLNIIAIPIRYFGELPDLERISTGFEWALRVYPTSSIIYYVTPPLDWNRCLRASLFCSYLDALINERLLLLTLTVIGRFEAITMGLERVYVFGWLPEGVYGGGISDPTWFGGAGIAAFGGDDWGEGPRTFAHEIGHLLGRRHTNTRDNLNRPKLCALRSWLECLGDPDCQTYVDNESDWPFQTSTIQDYGIDPLATTDAGRLKTPDADFDYMSYCGSLNWHLRPDSSPYKLSSVWTSPWTYSHIFSETLRLQGAAQALQATTAITQPYFIASGLVYTDDTAILDPIWVITPTVAPQNPSAGTQYCLEAQDVSGTALSGYCFDLTFKNYETGEATNVDGFNLMLPYPSGVARIVLRKGAQQLAIRPVSVHAPIVTVLSPNGGETWAATGTYTITWTASDADGDSLTYSVLYSSDGSNWLPVAVGITQTQVAVNAAELPGGSAARVRVLASDGVHTTADESDATFTVARKAPQAFILSPNGDITITPGTPLWLQGYAYDLEDGILPDTALRWSSSRDGGLGTGSQVLVSLSAGQHIITFTATDSDGNVTSATVRVYVGHKIYLPLVLRNYR